MLRPLKHSRAAYLRQHAHLAGNLRSRKNNTRACIYVSGSLNKTKMSQFVAREIRKSIALFFFLKMETRHETKHAQEREHVLLLKQSRAAYLRQHAHQPVAGSLRSRRGKKLAYSLPVHVFDSPNGHQASTYVINTMAAYARMHHYYPTAPVE